VEIKMKLPFSQSIAIRNALFVLALTCAIAVGLTGCATTETTATSAAPTQSRCDVQLSTSIASTSSKSANSKSGKDAQSELDRAAALAAIRRIEMHLPAHQRTGDSVIERLARDCS
jgi:hypothetical protein